MRRKRILIILMLVLAFALSSCAIRIATSLPTTSESTAPTTTVPTTAPTTSAPPAEWSIIADGASEFVLIVPRRAESAYISDIARSIRALAPSMKQTNDQSAPVEREILIGCTSRVESALVMARLAETASEEYFQFVIAETGGKLVVYAENDEAYSFVIDYLMATYVQGGALTVPSSLWDVQSMTWVAYRDMLDKIAAGITEDNPVWNGSATELVTLLQEDIQPNILTRRLNVKAGDLLNEYSIEYAVKRTRNGSFISLARKTV